MISPTELYVSVRSTWHVHDLCVRSSNRTQFLWPDEHGRRGHILHRDCFRAKASVLSTDVPWVSLLNYPQPKRPPVPWPCLTPWAAFIQLTVLAWVEALIHHLISWVGHLEGSALSQRCLHWIRWGFSWRFFFYISSSLCRSCALHLQDRTLRKGRSL